MARNYHQGKFKPTHPEKYAGDVENILYRSGWEKKFMIWADTNPNVIKWVSEEVIIPYLSPVDDRIHRYFVDFLIKVRKTSGEIRNYLIEIKPAAQTVPPEGKRNTRRLLEEHMTYAINKSKWHAAEEWCRQRNMDFMIITEKQLYGKN